MSYITGGETEKLANCYEDNVLICFYGQLMDGKYLSVMSESFDSNLERGGDIYLYDNVGKETVVQVKSRHGNGDFWSISSLINMDIIKNACHHISQGRKFVLASPLSCRLLQDLIKHSYAFDNYSNFFNAVKTKENTKDLSTLKNEIKKYLIEPDPIVFFHNFSLQRFEDDLDSFVSCLQNSIQAMDGGHSAFQLLCRYAVNNNKLSKKIYGDELWQYLLENGVRKYSIDKPAASRQIIDLCNEYKENIQHRLIRNKIYPRKEYDALRAKINKENIVIVHGKAGIGKSGIILQLCEDFDKNGDLYLPISLDAHMPKDNTYQFGKQLQLSASPVYVLSELAGERQAYLIIDQLDAIKWNVTHSTSAFAVCRNLVGEAICCKNVKLIFVCRTIDAEKILRFWNKDKPKIDSCSIEIKSLSENDVHTIVGDSVFRTLTPQVIALLTNINNLSMFLALSSTSSIKKSSDIIREYVSTRIDDIVKLSDYLEEQLRAIIVYMVNYMHENNTQTISCIEIENKYGNKVLDQLVSSGLIEKTKSSSKIKFAHQSILDYYFALKLDEEIKCPADAINVIKRYNDTAINDYEILKQYFEFAEVNSTYYAELINKILFSSQISSFIRHSALESFRMTLRTDTDVIRLVLKILTSKKYGERYLYYLAYGNYVFVKAYIESDAFTLLKQSTSNEDSTTVIDFLLFVANQDDNYLSQLKDYVISIKQKSDVLTHLFYQIDDATSSDALFAFKLELLSVLNFPNTLIHWDNILSLPAERAGEYISLILSNEIEHEYRVDWHKHLEALENIIKKKASHYCRLAEKYLIENCEKWELDGYDDFQFKGTKNLAKCILSMTLKFETFGTIIEFLQSPYILYNNLALTYIAENKTEKTTKLLKWMVDNRYLLSLDFFCHRSQLALYKRIIENHISGLNADSLNSLISQIKAYKSPNLVKFAKERIAQRKEGHYYHFYEEEQRILLCSIPEKFLDDITKSYVSYLKRKFPQAEYYRDLSYGIRCEVRNVVSGIGKKCLNFSYNTWKQILKSPKTGHNCHHKNEIDEDGNFVEYGRDDFERAITMAASVRQEMFVKLALNVNGIPRDFINAFCSGLSENSNSIKQRFPMAADADICDSVLKLQVYKKHFDISDKRFLMTFIDFVENTHTMNDWIEKKLIEIAKNPQQYENAEMNVWSSGWDHKLDSLSTYELETEKINRVQSRAIAVLSNNLFETKHLSTSLKEILDECCNERHPVLLFSAMDIIYSVWNLNEQLTIEYLVRILQKDMRVIRGRCACMLLDRIVVKHSDLLYEIFKKAIKYGDEYLSDIGERIIYYYCFYNVYRDLVSEIVKVKPDMSLECCLRVINDTVEVDKQARAKKLLLSIEEKTLSASYYPRLTDILLNNKNLKFSTIIIKKLKKLPRHEWHILLSDINELPELANIRDIILMLSDIVVSKNSLTSYESREFVGILVKLYSELFEKQDYHGWHQCLRKINLLYDKYVMNTIEVMTKFS